MKLSKKIAILATALISFAFISCDTDTDDSKPPAESSGSTEAGGSTGTGGSTGSGGSTETGGSGGTGGSTASGGSTETGGSGGTGGSTEAGGGAGAGGSTGSGGAGETGGSTEPGGTTGSGGSGEAGGSTGPGGAGETGGSTEPGGSTGSGGESEGNPVLPGIKGGADNEKDTFAGKTFYDSVEKDTAESYTKYVFSTDGTVEIRSKYEGVESSDAVINYSFSEDGKIVYMTYNKFNDGAGNLYTYEEFMQTGIDASVKFYMDNVFNEKVPEEDKKEFAEMFGLEAYTTDDAARDALKEKMSNRVRKIFSSVYQYDLSSDAAGPAVLTERITWGTDLSKFISLNGDTCYSYSNGVLEFSFTDVAGEFNCTYVDQNAIDPDGEGTLTRWIFRNVDDSKIYFKVKGETKVLGYTIFEGGNKLNLVIADNPIVAELKLGKMSLYN